VAEQRSTAEWRVMGETVPGASHLRAGIPNQDAILQVRASGRGLPLVVSISDGHGSNKCFRSDRGSRFAVRRAAQLVADFLDESRGSSQHAELESRANSYLPGEFVKRWRAAVEADLAARPLSKEELEDLEKKDGERARKLVEENSLLAYGATSLTIAVEESFVLYLQLGDGEIISVSETGQVVKALPEDERLFANETTSLCTADAEKNFRLRLEPLGVPPPALILLSTDGYVNSFSEAAGFLKVGSDLLEMLRADGFDPINASLKGWLEEATRAGSGDDCTLAVICRMDALSAPRAGPEAAASETNASAPLPTPEAATTTQGANASPPSQDAKTSPPASEPAQPQTADEQRA
jgi:serine/threonine protein phosphatase PrpC